MAVMITCPSCQRTMKGPDSIIGKTVKCPACQTQFSVTGTPPPPEPEPLVAPLAEDFEEATPRSRPAGGSSPFVEFLRFRRMIAPLIIQIIFWVGSVVLVLVGLFIAILSLAHGAFMASLFGFAYMVLGPIGLRVYCEVLIVFFRMYETMKEVRDGIDRMRKD
jgi:uncharacterized protein DUF4282